MSLAIAYHTDIAHLVRGAADPISTLRRYAQRVQYVHLKDISYRYLRDRPGIEIS